MRVEVEAYAAYKADERPLRFRSGERKYEVVELLDKWYGPADTWFKVLADDGGLYILKVDANSEWTLESFRAKPSQREQGPVQAGSPLPSGDEP
jgi:hypothetical protein